MKDADIRRDLERTPKEKLSERIEELAFQLNISKKSLQARALKAGFRMRGERSNKGQTAMEETTLMIIATRVKVSKKCNSDQFMCSVKKAIEDVRKEGLEVPVGYQRVCVLLREMGIDKESLLVTEPHVRLVSLHPNHVHQFDVTNCLQWHFKHGGGMTEEDLVWLYPNKVLEKAKERDKKLKLLRFVMIDHKSGAFFFWYYYTTGERPQDGADFFLRAWSKKEQLIEKSLGVCGYDGAYQFHGLPKILMSDKGSILTSAPIANLMGALGIKVELHKRHNPRAKGAVEHSMHIIGTGFESNLRFWNIQNLDDLNAAALDWCIRYNETKEFRSKNIFRANLWLKIKREELRLCPDEKTFYSLVSTTEEERNVNGNGELSYKGQLYYCDNSNVCNKTVIVKMNLIDAPIIHLHYNKHVYDATPVVTDEYGVPQTPTNSVIGEEYKRHKKTDTQKIKNELEKIAEERYGIVHEGEHKKRIAKPTIKNVLPEVETKRTNISYLKAEGIDAETPNPYTPLTQELYVNIHDRQTHQVRLISPAELIKRYMTAYGKLTPEQNKYIRTAYPDGAPADISITELYNLLNAPEEKDNAKNNVC